MPLEDVIAERRRAREALLDGARSFVAALGGTLALRAAVVFGSAARGVFNRWSDVDVLLVAEGLPSDLRGRLELCEPRPPLVQPVLWTAEEWRRRLARGDPMALEARDAGVWLVGAARDL